MSRRPTLIAAVAALRTGDHAAARDALVRAWQDRRSPTLAAMVAQLDARAPDATSAAIAALVTPRATSSLANLRALGKLDDPRLAGWAIDALVRLPFTAVTARAFLLAVANTAVRHGDPRLAARAPEIRAALATRIGRLAIRTELLRIVERGIAKLPAVRLATARERAAETELAALVEPLGDVTRSIDALYAEIYANPEDDGPRLVLADALSAQGDPRGELIVLQLERARTGGAEPGARERELLGKHGKAWLGDLAPVLSWGKGYSRTTFRRGFVAKADVILSVGNKLRPILAHPAWATVEEIDGLFDDEHGLLARAPLRGLRELELDDDDMIARIAKRADPLPAVRRLVVMEPISVALRAVFPGLVTLTHAYCDGITHALIAAYVACGTAHVELLHQHVNEKALRKARAAFDRLVAELRGAPASIARLTLGSPGSDAHEPVRVELVRGGDGRFA